MSDRLSPREDTRPCECCGEAGALSLGRECLCSACTAGECDPHEGACRRPPDAWICLDCGGAVERLGDDLCGACAEKWPVAPVC